MKKIRIISIAVILSLHVPCTRTTSRIFTNDSIQISGRITGFDPAQEEKFISFQTYDIAGQPKRQAIQIAADGSFSFTVTNLTKATIR
jgi:hypothetical protein